MSLPKGYISAQDSTFVTLRSHPDDFLKKNNYHLENNKTKKLFFDRSNMIKLQQDIIHTVYHRSNGKYIIEKQNPQSIFNVMRYIYQTYYNPDTEPQIMLKRLNQMVLAEICPDIVSNLDFRVKTSNEIWNPPGPIGLPKNVSNKGAYPLPSTTTVFEY